MLDVFPAKIHGTIPVTNPGLIYGAMLFRTFFWKLFLYYMGCFADANWNISWHANWDDNCDANWDVNWDDNCNSNWDVNWDANYRPK